MTAKILFLSSEGNGCDLAARMAMEGSDVRLFIDSKECKANFDGIVEKVNDFKPSMRWADFIVWDDVEEIKGTSNTVFAKTKEMIGRMGIPAYGQGHNKKIFKFGDVRFSGFSCAETLETKRAVMQDIVRDLKMGEDIESYEFDDVKEAPPDAPGR